MTPGAASASSKKGVTDYIETTRLEALAPDEVENGWIAFVCPEHGFLVATTPSAVVKCGSCGWSSVAKAEQKEVELDYWREFAIADRIYWLKEFPEAPTPEGLRRHAARFGPEGVKEIADAYGVDLTATTQARSPKRLSAGKRKRTVARAREALIT